MLSEIQGGKEAADVSGSRQSTAWRGLSVAGATYKHRSYRENIPVDHIKTKLGGHTT